MYAMIPAKEARRIAEHMWGTGGTHAYTTGRKGFWYYSCSGHGGFVVDGHALTRQEKESLEKLRFKPFFEDADFWVKAGKLNAGRSKRFRVSFDDHCVQKNIYLFEEDCAWSIAVVLLGIRRCNSLKGVFKHVSSDAALMEMAQETFNKWYGPNSSHAKKMAETTM